MQLKSFLAGGAVAAVLGSIVMADQISVPNQFTAGSPARAAEVNANFDVLVQESNAQDVRISAIDEKVSDLSSIEQLFCAADPRASREFIDPVRGGVVGFPMPSIRFGREENLAVNAATPAICISLLDSATLIESSSSQLAADGWKFIRPVEGASPLASFRRNGSFRLNPWYLYER